MAMFYPYKSESVIIDPLYQVVILAAAYKGYITSPDPPGPGQGHTAHDMPDTDSRICVSTDQKLVGHLIKILAPLDEFNIV